MPGSVHCTFSNQMAWQQQPLNMPAQKGIAYLWYGQTAELLPFYNHLFSLLNDTEKAAALRYFQQADRQRYVIQHGLLRLLLGWYLNEPTFTASFIQKQQKKPHLADAEHRKCFFNLSHSYGAFLIAITDRELGVDIERIKPDFSYQDIASQYFGRDEIKFIENSEYASLAFFLLWTRKEALLKACGTGIDDRLPLIPALDGQHTLPSGYDNIDWQSESFKLADCMMSITYPVPQMPVQLYQFNPDWISSVLTE